MYRPIIKGFMLLLTMCKNIIQTLIRANRLCLNTAKCKGITFTRSPSPLHVTYNLDGSAIDRVSAIRDLGLACSIGYSLYPCCYPITNYLLLSLFLGNIEIYV